MNYDLLAGATQAQTDAHLNQNEESCCDAAELLWWHKPSQQSASAGVDAALAGRVLCAP